jgi:ribosomal protein S27E
MAMVPLVSVEYARNSLPEFDRWRRTERSRPVSLRPEGYYGRCPVCGEFVCVAFSDSAGEAPCPSCGQLFWRHELRWPVVLEDQGMPLRGEPTVRQGPSRARRFGLVVHRVGRWLRIAPPAPPRLPSPSSSTMYDRWLDG